MGQKFEKNQKNIEPIVSSEVLELCGNDKYVKWSLDITLSDGNILVNIWSTPVDQIVCFRKIHFSSTFLKKIENSKKSKYLVNT